MKPNDPDIWNKKPKKSLVISSSIHMGSVVATLREEYQAKVDRAVKLLKLKKYTTRESTKTRQDIEHLKEIYEYRIECIDRDEKRKKEQKEREKVSNYKEMIDDMESRDNK